MRFSWPLALLLLLLVPATIGAYLLWLKRKRKYAVQYSSLALIREAMPSSPSWRRHLPFVLLLGALTSLAVGAARPQLVRDISQNRTSIILALDVSRSMCAVDVEPNRLTVAQEAARTFIEGQAGEAQIGIVAFAGTARLVVPPTNDTEVLLDAITNFRTAFGTTIGGAQLKAIDAIAAVNPNVAPAGDDLPELSGPVLDGQYESDIVVLLTDGANSGGPDPIEAAQAAAARRVRIYTIGFGTDEPTEMICGGTQIGADAFGNGAFGSDGVGGDSFGGITGSFGGGGGRGGEIASGGLRQLLVIDEPTLQSIADLTGGAYFRAQDSEQLVDVFLNLPSEIEVQQEEREVSVWFTALAFALILAAMATSLRFNRL